MFYIIVPNFAVELMILTHSLKGELTGVLTLWTVLHLQMETPMVMELMLQVREADVKEGSAAKLPDSSVL